MRRRSRSFGVLLFALALAVLAIPHHARAQTNGVSSSAANTVGLWANGTESLHISSSGLVGIGTTGPLSTLDVRETTNQRVVFVANGNGNDTGAASLTSLNDSNTGTEPLAFVASRFDFNGGNVGIGTTSPNAPLHISTGATFNPSTPTYAFNQIEMGFINVTGFGANGFAFSNASTGSGFGLIAENGDTMSFGHSSGTTASVLMSIGSTGILTVVGPGTTCTIGNGTGATNCTSDERLKTDIAPIPDALAKLAKIKGVTFHWKDPKKSGPEHIGVIAQDVEQVFPQAVGEVDDKILGKAKTVDIAALVAPLIEAVKELKADNDDLRARVDALEAANK